MPSKVSKKSPEILLGVGGSIAAYKAADVVSGLKKRGAAVTVLLTPAAARFVSPLTMKVLSERPVGLNLWEEPAEWGVGHVTLAKRAACYAVVGATADLIAKLALGLADDFVTACALVARGPRVLAPAMNTAMWEHPATQGHLATLRSRGWVIVDPTSGDLACGDVGKGKLADVAQVIEAICLAAAGMAPAQGLHRGARVLLTAGPTREALDPVRYLSNPSTGKMGYALARALRSRGATVSLVSGPVSLDAPEGVTRTTVETARQMLAACQKNYATCDIFVATAAVSDFRPEKVAAQKKKKGTGVETLRLVANPDILKTLAAKKGKRLFVGFAAETENLLENAQAKLKSKKLDLLIANPVGGGRGFGADENQVTLLAPGQSPRPLPKQTKLALAERLADEILTLWNTRKGRR